MFLNKCVRLALLLASATSFSAQAFTITLEGRAAACSTCRWAEEGKKDAETPAEKKVSDPVNDILNSPAFLKRKLEVLHSDVAKVEADIDAAKQKLDAGKAEWGPQLNDLKTEYAKIQERMTKQSKGGDEMAITQVARQMLDVLDNCDRAFGSIKPENDEQRAIETDYKQSYQMILDTFKDLGVEEVPTVGTEFDYEVHQAVMQKPSEEHGEGIVCDELRKGFRIGKTLVRAAMVAVAL